MSKVVIPFTLFIHPGDFANTGLKKMFLAILLVIGKTENDLPQTNKENKCCYFTVDVYHMLLK